MKKNHVSAEELLTMSPADLDVLTVDQLLIIQQEIIEKASIVKSLSSLYEGILSKRYSSSIAKAYEAKDDEYGKATFNDGSQEGYVVEVETPKNVSWDQDAIKAGEHVVRDWGEDPEEYIVVKRSIPEAKYNAWPNAIQKVFEPARKVKTGKRKISIKLVDKEEAA